MEFSGDENGAYSGRDRLSNLSDCLLHTILSRLKARQVVQTCLLSRRWRHLWLSAPSADIDTREFQLYYWRERAKSSSLAGLSDDELEKLCFGKLEDTVDNLLLHHSARLLHTLRLRVDDLYDQTAPCMPRWIRRALSCGPAVLVIHYAGSIVLPPRSPGTRRLTKLCLHQVRLCAGFGQQITFDLPVLEDLSFRNSDVSTLSRIKSATLKNLTLDCCYYKTTSASRSNSLIVIATPRLTSLHFSIMLHGQWRSWDDYRSATVHGNAPFFLAEAPFLDEASICLVKPKNKPHYWGLNCKMDTDGYIIQDLSKLLRSLFNSNVSSLKLAGFKKMLVDEKDAVFPVPNKDGILQASRTLWRCMHNDKSVHCPMLHWILEEALITIPLFGNLRTLILDNCEAGEQMQVLWRFLHNAPVLETLTLNNCKFSDGSTLGRSSCKLLASNILDMPQDLKLLEIRYNDQDAHQLQHQGMRPIEDVLSMIRTKLPATTMIRVTNLPRKTREN